MKGGVDGGVGAKGKEAIESDGHGIGGVGAWETVF